MAIDKQAYAAPTVSRIGTFEEITQGSSSGTTLDAALPVTNNVAELLAFIATHQS